MACPLFVVALKKLNRIANVGVCTIEDTVLTCPIRTKWEEPDGSFALERQPARIIRILPSYGFNLLRDIWLVMTSN